MKTKAGVAALAAILLIVAAGCASTGRGPGPMESFLIPAASNPSLAADIVGELNLRTNPVEVHLVVPAGTDLHALVARFTLNTEATISVISTGSKVLQQNGVTPNDFSVPVLYSVEIPGQKEPWRYKVTARVVESNALLAQLVLPAGSRLQPPFDPAVHQYRAELPFASSIVHLEARAQSRYAKSVAIAGKESPGAIGRADLDFSTLTQLPVAIDSLAEDGQTRDHYTVTLVRGAPDSNALLGSLSIQGLPFTTPFAPNQFGYQLVAAYETQSLVIKAQPQSGVAKLALSAAASLGEALPPPLAVSGNPASSTGATIAFTQPSGLTLIVTVTAQNGAVQQYLVTVMRAAPDANSLLADLSLEVGGIATALSPAFVPSQLRYAAVLPFAARQLKLTAHPQSKVATLRLGSGQPGVAVQGDPLSRGGALVDLVQGFDRSSLLLMVTAQNGSATGYVIDLRRAQPDRNSELGFLGVSGGVLTPAFNPRIQGYSILLPAAQEGVTLNARTASPLASVSIAGAPAAAPVSNLAYVARPAPGASLSLSLVVRAEDGSQRQYLVQVSRAALPPAAPSPAPTGPASPAPTAPVVTSPPAPAAPTPAPAPSAPTAAAPQSAQPAPPAPAPAAPAATSPTAPAPASPAPVAVAPATPAPALAPGSDHVVIAARALALGRREVAALVAAKDSPGKSARIAIRPYRSTQLLAQDSIPVELKMQGDRLQLSFQYRSAGIGLGRDNLVEIEIVIPTTAGRYLYYKEAMPGGSELSLAIPFFLYLSSVPMAWPAPGSAVQVGGYLSLGKQHPEERDLQKDAKGDYQVELAFVDEASGKSLGTVSVPRKPGLARGRTLAFVMPLSLPEGATVGYTMSARAAGGRTFAAKGQAQVWTTKLRYEGGFEPVFLPLGDELSASSN